VVVGTTHDTVVPDVQDAVPQPVRPISTEGVRSSAPAKSRPEIVRTAPELAAKLNWADPTKNEATGASNVNVAAFVPTERATVRTKGQAAAPPMPFVLVQETVVDEVQPVVAHGAGLKKTEAVTSAPAKFKPLIVRPQLFEFIALTGAETVEMGGSYVKTRLTVPTTPDTVTMAPRLYDVEEMPRLRHTPVGYRVQMTVVPVVHDVVVHGRPMSACEMDVVGVRSLAPKFSPSKVICPPVMAALEGKDVGTGESYVNQAFVPVPTMPETVSAKEMAVALVVSGGTQATDVGDDQTVVLHVAESVPSAPDRNAAVAVGSAAPKLLPTRDTNEFVAPRAVFWESRVGLVTVGASNVIETPARVPTIPPTTTVAGRPVRVGSAAGTRHVIRVSVTHEVEVHAVDPTDAVGDGLFIAKFTPSTVTDWPPLPGPFGAWWEVMSGESKDISPADVPTTPVIETNALSPDLLRAVEDW